MEDVVEDDVFISFVSPLSVEEEDDVNESLKHETEVEELVVDIDIDEDDVLCSFVSPLYSVDNVIGVVDVVISLFIDMDNAIAKFIASSSSSSCSMSSFSSFFFLSPECFSSQLIQMS